MKGNPAQVGRLVDE